MTEILHPIKVKMPLLIVSKSVGFTLIAGEDEALSVPACVDLASLFEPRAFGFIKHVEELSLSANSPRHSAVCHVIIYHHDYWFVCVSIVISRAWIHRMAPCTSFVCHYGHARVFCDM
jgi:hypothetical protein